MSKRMVRAGWGALAVVCALIMVRQIFVGLEIDEPYALALGFRLVQGDRLFAQMWEPHQLCSLPPALLVAAYLGLTGTTTGLLVFVRAVLLVCKAALSWAFYREFVRDLGKSGAGLAALVLFLYTPKWFLGPDYIGQQFLFTVAAFLCFHHYVTRGFRRPWLVAVGGVFACLSFLAYPQSAAAFPVLWLGLFLLGRRGGEPRFLGIPRGAWVLLGSCAVCGGAFLLWALAGMGFDVAAFLERVGLILNDPQYGFTAAEKLAQLARQSLSVLRGWMWPLAAALVIGAWLFRRKASSRERISLLLGLGPFWPPCSAFCGPCGTAAWTNGSLCRCWCWPGRGPSGVPGGWTAYRRSSGWAACRGWLPTCSSCAPPCWTARHFSLSDLAGVLRAAGSAAPPAPDGPRPAGGHAGLFCGLPGLVRPDHRLEVRHRGRHAAGGH